MIELYCFDTSMYGYILQSRSLVPSPLPKMIYETGSTFLVQWHQNHMLRSHDQPTSTLSYVAMIIVVWWFNEATFVHWLTKRLRELDGASFFAICHIFTMVGTVLHNNIVSDYFIGHPRLWEWSDTGPGMWSHSFPHHLLNIVNHFEQAAGYETNIYTATEADCSNCIKVGKLNAIWVRCTCNLPPPYTPC